MTDIEQKIKEIEEELKKVEREFTERASKLNGKFMRLLYLNHESKLQPTAFLISEDMAKYLPRSMVKVHGIPIRICPNLHDFAKSGVCLLCEQ